MKLAKKEDANLRLKRMAGQISGIQQMIDEDRYCLDVLTQVAALRAALESFGFLMAAAHIEECVYGDKMPDDPPALRLDEVRRTLHRFLR
jgi:DNA-binding FrmR family transcriptional regulator